MIPADIICQNCGWRNEPTARMCGGCGQPLRVSDPGATAYAGAATTPAAWSGAGAGDPALVSHDAQTLAGQGSGVAAPPLPTPRPTSSPPGQVAWPGVTAGRRAKRVGDSSAASSAPWWRIPLIAVIVLAVLVAGALGTWAFVVGPSMHSDFDAQMQSVLDSGVNGTFDVKVSAGQHTIPAKTFNDFVAHFFPNDSAVTNVKVTFANGQEIVSYSFWGSSGTATTNLSVVNGRVVARGTSVDCPLCFIETGDEMEATFNAPFSSSIIPAAVKITNIQTTNDSLVFTVGS